MLVQDHEPPRRQVVGLDVAGVRTDLRGERGGVGRDPGRAGHLFEMDLGAQLDVAERSQRADEGGRCVVGSGGDHIGERTCDPRQSCGPARRVVVSPAPLG